MDDVLDPELPERARRRTCTVKHERDVLAEHEAADRTGKGTLLRREGLHSSLISSSVRPARGGGPAGAGQVLGPGRS